MLVSLSYPQASRGLNKYLYLNGELLMSVENVEVGNLSTFAHGTQIKFVDVDGVERSG